MAYHVGAGWPLRFALQGASHPAPIHHHRPTMTDFRFRALCAELLNCDDGSIFGKDLVTRAEAALKEAEGKKPTEDQLDIVVIAIQSLTPHSSNTDSHNLEAVDRGRRILQRAITRWGRPAPAPKPIPVSERPWEREGWCDAEGRCWFCNAYSMGKWTYETAPDSEQDWKILGLNTDSLPHWAIARPRPKVKEIES